MKNRFIFILLTVSFIITSCAQKKSMDRIIDETLAFSVKQYSLMTEVMKVKPGLLPRTIDAEGNLRTESSRWWTSGFYHGSCGGAANFTGSC